MNLKERLERAIALAGPKPVASSLATDMNIGDCRKVLGLLDAAELGYEAMVSLQDKDDGSLVSPARNRLGRTLAAFEKEAQ